MSESARRPIAILERCFAAIAEQDVDRLVSHYTEDYVLEFPYRTPEKALVVEGREAVRAYLAGPLRAVRMRLTIESARWIEEEALLITEYSSQGRFLDTDEPCRNRYVGYWFFEGDLVRHTREYYNPQARRKSSTG